VELAIDKKPNDIHCGWQKVNLMTKKPNYEISLELASPKCYSLQMGP